MSNFDHYFSNHIAEKIELDTLTIIDYYNPDYDLLYNLRFIFDKKNCTLSISGDFGNLAAQNFYNLGDYHKTYEHFCNNIGYFVDKIKSCSRNIYTYDIDKAKSYILEQLLSDDDENKEEISEKIDELFEYFSDTQGFQHISDESREWLSSYDSDYWEWIGYAGKTVSNIIYLFLDAYKRAYEYLKKEVGDGSKK
ncbi:Uncharacterised protein [Streptococcus equi subsp. equi]|uniref:hypothetical protein n=1 Tax=Streptococcus equi TaxID=1336 RepID=UPI0006598B6E|nr:hypothetical protein [Streptococcus equi]QBX15468.1 hypothetical protein Javan187_0032 [Streptococcus phage Javan187]HEK9998179.1 hypothetical protein [Streptococcus equi subsp. zooepidemicus]CRQ98730.1 Uncharacterised protein [Streptococcus equi subsp. equi]CRR04020.1 Uncharacterised protein [Streptococcus equi subsp. equi]CRT02845.1 Uncharacterised protein [Streptococcus equi subsp. equi]